MATKNNPNQPCPIRNLKARRTFWHDLIEGHDDFERVIRELAEQWTFAEIDGMCVSVTVHQLDKEDTL